MAINQAHKHHILIEFPTTRGGWEGDDQHRRKNLKVLIAGCCVGNGKLCSFQFVVAFDFRLMITLTFSRNLYSVSIWFDRCVDRPVAVVFMKQWCCSICWESRKRRDFMCVLSAWHYIKSSIISERLMIVFGFHSLLPYSYCDTNTLTLSPISFSFPAPLFFLPAAWRKHLSLKTGCQPHRFLILAI